MSDKQYYHLKEKIKISGLSTIAFSGLWALDKSYRVEKVNYKPELSPVIYAIWHGWQYGLLGIPDRKNLSLLVSKSIDGEIISRISKNLGFSLIRGSQGRGGTEALIRIIRTLRGGGNIAYTVDGPRGPIHEVKGGIIKISQMAKVPIVPLAPAVNWKITAKSWDQYKVPLLFAKIVNVFGDPIYIPKDITESEEEHFRSYLESKLFELRDQAEDILSTRF